MPLKATRGHYSELLFICIGLQLPSPFAWTIKSHCLQLYVIYHLAHICIYTGLTELWVVEDLVQHLLKQSTWNKRAKSITQRWKQIGHQHLLYLLYLPFILNIFKKIYANKQFFVHYLTQKMSVLFHQKPTDGLGIVMIPFHCLWFHLVGKNDIKLHFMVTAARGSSWTLWNWAKQV